jgi:hypothetical protein
MDRNKSLDELVKLIAALSTDALIASGVVPTQRYLRLNREKLMRRTVHEGPGFLTKALPRLGKHFDQVLAGSGVLNPTKYGFPTIRGTRIPILFGILFSRVIAVDGSVLPDPDAKCVLHIRQVLYSFYKYELPYEKEQELQVVNDFKKAEDELSLCSDWFRFLGITLDQYAVAYPRPYSPEASSEAPFLPEQDMQVTTLFSKSLLRTARVARITLSRVFSGFDPLAIHPRHGPGAVATKQRLWSKYLWTNVSERITNVYPLDAYFYASLGHVCDDYRGFSAVDNQDLPARVLLVPKDSRGPRLISCEPVDFQWVQQGLGRRIVDHVESCHLTKSRVNFTDQEVNRQAALKGSLSADTVTLDLKEASDRVHLGLVRLLFPEHVFRALEACRSSSTVLPNGEVLKLHKFAPMGSALCFPIMALTIWSLLYAAAPDADTRNRIFVYGDDVIVPRHFAESAIAQLEAFHLKVNRDKSCVSGFFRESCGMDAFRGVCVTPVRFRTVWDNSPRPEIYSSWIAYANSFWDRSYFNTYHTIVDRLSDLFGYIPSKDMNLSCPSLPVDWHNADQPAPRRRWCKNLHRFFYRVRDVVSRPVRKSLSGWSMLLRYFSEAGNDFPLDFCNERHAQSSGFYSSYTREPFSVREYTKRNASKLAYVWR